jgi:hypothetical protein
MKMISKDDRYFEREEKEEGKEKGEMEGKRRV